MLWTGAAKTLLSRPTFSPMGECFPTSFRGVTAVPTLPSPSQSSSRSETRDASKFAQHSGYLCLATAMLGMLALLFVAGCQTPQTASTVAPPATGMIGQPAQYGSWATPPQGAAYPPTASTPPMPGPATQWQGAAPANTMAQPAGTMPQQQFANQVPTTNQFKIGRAHV